MHHVIIGNGIAGVSAVEAIRSLDPKAQITLVGDETFPPYSRPMISYVLDGSQPLDKLTIRAEDFYGKMGVVPVLGHRVTRVDPESCSVEIQNGAVLSYDRLLIATGADPRPVKADGANQKGIFYMRTEAHVRGQLESLEGVRQALVLGGGLVGFKAAYGLLKRGIEVTLLITSGYPLSMQVDDTAGRMILEELVSRGLRVEVGTSVKAFEGNGRVTGAITSDGKTLPCQMVIIGKGVIPALKFIPRDRISVDLGILVDSHQQTTHLDIYAAGDVAECMDIARCRRWVNAIWPEAAAQGRVAGFNMVGRGTVYPGSLSRNVMRVFGLNVLTVGNVNPDPADGAEVLTAGGLGRGFYRRLVFKEDRLVGAILINCIEQGGVLRSVVESGRPVTIPKTALLSEAFNFRMLLP
jgi:nitrite reductase (NADH) large subunit